MCRQFVAFIVVMEQTYKARHNEIEVSRYLSLLFDDLMFGIAHWLHIVLTQINFWLR
ncbi:hypothetical protein D3C81_1926080 [compost metagenome]